MLEELAYQYADLTEGDLRLLHYSITIFGGFVGGLTSRSTAELQRAPYFALLCWVILAVGAVNYAFVPFLVGAVFNGYLWTIVGTDLLMSLIGGFFIARIAQARSRNAYGHPDRAALAFIPFANLWLILTPSKHEVSANQVPTVPLLSGVVGVFFGFVALLTGIFFIAASEMGAEKRIEAAGDDPDLQAMGIEMLLGRQGLEATLRQMAVEVPSQQVDETTTLLNLEANGTTLRYVYRVNTDNQRLRASMRNELINHNCTYESMALVIQAGATIEHFYSRLDGTELGTVTITQAICENPQPHALAQPTESDIIHN